MTRSWQAPWDDGITWKTEVVSVDRTRLPLDLEFVRDKVLRAVTDQAEDGLIQNYIRAATDLCERESGDLIWPAQHRMRLSAFPCGKIVFPDAPVREVTSIDYVDAVGSTASVFGGSPPEWIFSPAGRFGKASVEPPFGSSWPTPLAQADAVLVTYEVGYDDVDDISFLLKQGIALVVGELYKNPDLSNNEGQAKNLLGLERFWPRRW